MKVERDGPVHRLCSGGEPLSWEAFALGLVNDPDLRSTLTRTLAESEHTALFWECCPRRDGSGPFEYVVVPARGFRGQRADPSAFRSHFRGQSVATFDNLGKDARLVVPEPGEGDFLHLASFVRTAESDQVHALWQAVGREALRWDRGTLWLSTSGLGVPWVHVRLDTRPKYYAWAPYR